MVEQNGCVRNDVLAAVAHPFRVEQERCRAPLFLCGSPAIRELCAVTDGVFGCAATHAQTMEALRAKRPARERFGGA